MRILYLFLIIMIIHYFFGVKITFVEPCFPSIVNVSSHLTCMAAFESSISAAYLICFADSTSALAVIIFAYAALLVD